MNREQLISTMDSALCESGQLLRPEQREEMHDLIVEARGAAPDEEGVEPELPLRLHQLYKILQLKVRDASPAVNEFTINGQPLWYGPDLRSNLRNSINSLEGEETVSFQGITLPTDVASAALTAVEKYAAKCTERTEAHEAAIEALATAEAIEAYDFTTGYPEKLQF